MEPRPEDALLSSVPPGTAVVVGASGGIGAALVAHLLAGPGVTRVVALARDMARLKAALAAAGAFADATAASADAAWAQADERLSLARVDLADEASIAQAAAGVAQSSAPPRLVIVASGRLHGGGLRPEKHWGALDAAALAQAFAVNATGPALVAKHFLPLLPRQGKAVFAALSARVGSIEDNRSGGWYAYRASKAALNMMIRTLAIELARRAPQAACIGLHPGTVDTALSQPFQANVPPGKLFSPAQSAGYLLRVIDRIGPADSGNVFAWDGQRIPA